MQRIFLPLFFCCKMARLLLSVHKAKCFSLFVNVMFLFLLLCVTLYFNSSEFRFLNNFKNPKSVINFSQILNDDIGCKGIDKYNDNQAKCLYVTSHKGCKPKGYISYLQLFYCTLSPSLGYTLLGIWLLVLFYLLGDTASSYFCSSLEGLSRSLKLSPTVAGVTLLSLGNGAPDVFDSIVSFMGDGTTKDIGLNSILGGSLFVSTVVVGIVSISVCNHGRTISYSSFTGNVFFLLFCLSCLLAIIIIGKISFWGALCFLSLYFIYVAFIFASETYACRGEKVADGPFKSTALPVTRSSVKRSPDGSTDLQVPLLGFAVDESPTLDNYDQHELGIANHKGRTRCNIQHPVTCFFSTILYLLELPLDLPRKLTIPIMSDEKWSKAYAVISTALAPVLLAAIWNIYYPEQKLLVYAIGSSVGAGSAILLFCITDRSNPPRKYMFPWLAESFLMSIIWTYIFAQELISLLVSLGMILGISHSLIGLTVLAWGNSLGDLFSNVTVAKNGGQAGAQVAISGCYAGPIFNIVVGLGLSFAFSSWAIYPPYVAIIRDPSLYESFGFLILGILWALVVVTKRNMKLDKLLGFGLLAIYSCFLILKLARIFGLPEFHPSPLHFKHQVVKFAH